MKKYAKLLMIPAAFLAVSTVNAASYTLTSDPINITVDKNAAALPAPANKTVYISLDDINGTLDASKVKTATTGLTSYVTATLEGTAPVASSKCTLAKTIDSSNSVCYVADIANTTYTPTAEQITAAKNVAYTSLSDDDKTALGSCTQEQVVAETNSDQTCYNATVANATHTATAAETANAVEAAYNAALNTTVKLDTTTGTDGSYTANITAVELGDNDTLTIASGKTIEVSTINAGKNTTIIVNGTLKGVNTEKAEITTYGAYKVVGGSATVKVTYKNEIAAPVWATSNAINFEDGKVKLDWEEVAGADYYVVKRAVVTDEKVGSYTTLTSTLTKTEYTDSSVSAGKTYSYKIAAKRADKTAVENETAKEVSTTIDEPGKITTSVTYKSVKLTAAKVTGATGYAFYKSENGTKWELLKQTTSNTYTDSDVDSGKTYYYTVATYTKTGNTYVYSKLMEEVKAFASEANATAGTPELQLTENVKEFYTENLSESNKVKKATPKLGTVTISSVKDLSTQGRVKVTVKSVTGASGYVVYLNNKDYFCTITGTTCSNSSSDKLAVGNTNVFTAVAYRGSDARKELEAVGTHTGATHNYAWLDNNDQYQISKEVEHVINPTAPKIATSKVKLLTTESKDPDNEATPVPCADGKTCGYYNTIKVTVTDYTDNVTADDSVAYVLYKATSKNGTYKKVDEQTGTNANVFYVSQLSTGKTYYFKAKVRVNGKLSGYSTVVSKATKMTPYFKNSKVDDNLKVLNNNGKEGNDLAYYNRAIELTMNEVEGATGYAIYRATSKSGKYSLVKTLYTSNLELDGTKFTWKNTKLTAGQKYYYKVRAFRTVNGKKVYGAYSTILSATAKLKAPEDLEVEDTTKTTAKLSWEKVSGATGYRVYVDDEYVGSTSSTSYTLKKLESKSDYKVYVRAYTKLNGKTKVGLKSDEQTVTTAE